MNGRPTPDDARDLRIATACSALLIATQVGGKAARDAMFLSSFPVERLPLMIGAAAVVSLATVVLASMAMQRAGPRRFVPGALVLSAALLAVFSATAERAPGIVAVAVYLHVAALGGALVSGFWSTLNERFDPRTARRRFGRVALGGTAGGLLGGLAAERLAAFYAAPAVLAALALLHLACALLLRSIPGFPREDAVPEGGAEESPTSGWTTLRRGYLRNLAVLILLVTIAGVFLDYVFKAQATASLHSRDDLLRFFALFYTGVSLATLLVQAGIAERMLERVGLANTVATLPIGVALASAASLLVPGLASASGARGLESTLRNSLFRSGYEPLFVPVPVQKKRWAKQMIDVGCERIGDLSGGAFVALTLIVVPSATTAVLLSVAIVLSLAGYAVTRRLHSGWVNELAGRLEDRAFQLDLDHESHATKTMIFRSLDALELRPLEEDREEPESPGAAPADSPDASGILVLLGGNAEQIRRLIVRTPSLPDSWVPLVIPLLARDDLKDVSAQALRAVAPHVAGQLLDHLLDPEESFTIRRRIPPLLHGCPAPRVVDGLFEGLLDRRFEVRYQCARTLLHFRQQEEGDEHFDRERVLDAVLREVQVGRHVWDGHRLLDGTDDAPASPFDERALRRRSALGLEHVFTLLALALPAMPLAVAYRGLFTKNAELRGTSLEYLESVLPERVRDLLWPHLDAAGPAGSRATDRDEALSRLLRSQTSIRADLDRQDDS